MTRCRHSPLWRSRCRNYVHTPDRWLTRYRAKRLARGRTIRRSNQGVDSAFSLVSAVDHVDMLADRPALSLAGAAARIRS